MLTVNAQPADAGPNHPELPVHGVQVGAPRTIPGTIGDTWATAWADDDQLYSPVNDGPGFVANLDALGIFDGAQRRMIENDPDATRKFRSAGAAGIGPEAIQAFSVTADQQKRYLEAQYQYEAWRRRNLGSAWPRLGFNRIGGSDPLALHGVNINSFRDFNAQDLGRADPRSPSRPEVGLDGRTWKSAGCSFIDGMLYLAISRHDYGDPLGERRRQDAANASFIRSSDYGRTWTRSAELNRQSPMFPGPSFSTPYFVEYGRTRPVRDGAERYVYAVSNNGFWDNGDALMLGRVRRPRLAELNGADWEFFRGGDGMDDANWVRDPGQARPILRDPRQLGETGAIYLPARRCYLMIAWFYPDGTGHAVGAAHRTRWNFFEALHPWGPWVKIGSHTWFPQGYYCPVICPKFQSADRLYVVTAGDFSNSLAYYHLTVVPLDLK